MLRKAVVAIALTLLPVAASAQEHKHGESTTTTTTVQHSHASTAMHGQHVNYAQLIMQKREELKLTEEQVARLEDYSAMMEQHKAQMSKPGAPQASEMDHARMHESLMAIFTPEQATRVRALMKQHEEQCAKGEDKQCKIMPTEVKPKQ